MQQTITNHWTTDNAIKHMELFIEDHYQHETLVHSLLNAKVTTKTFFSPLKNFFSIEEEKNLVSSNLFFFGQTLALRKEFLKTYTSLSIGDKILKYQVQLSLTEKHTDRYQNRHKEFQRMCVGDIMDHDFVECIVKNVGLKLLIFPDTQLGNNHYRCLLHAMPLFCQYHLIHFFLWDQKKN